MDQSQKQENKEHKDLPDLMDFPDQPDQLVVEVDEENLDQMELWDLKGKLEMQDHKVSEDPLADKDQRDPLDFQDHLDWPVPQDYKVHPV